ncbi:MAG TPA: YdbH domain-containing protein [Novosphingobium sp.]|nr:YdbH domain-containing protein [Novosphingobium sp.]
MDGAADPVRRRWPRVFGVVGALLLVALAGVWLVRKDLADRVISGQLADLGLPATYQIERIGPRQQVLSNVVIGDPAHPDLTIERAYVDISPRFGIPAISRITLVRPRLYGSYRGGKLSFGSLDKVLFADSKQPFKLPDLELGLVDGRARLVTDYGPVGFKAQGGGKLRGGFAGILAAVAPRLANRDCVAEAASLYGAVTIAAERPHFAGPLRLGTLRCPRQQLAISRLGVELDGRLDPAFDGGEGKAGIESGSAAYGANQANGVNGAVDFAYRSRALTARYNLLGRGISTPQATAATLSGEGTLRSSDGFARIEVEGSVDGGGLRLGSGFDAALAQAERRAEGTLAAPMLGQIRAALLREGRNSRLTGGFVARRTGQIFTLLIPQGALRGGSGATLLDLSRFQLTTGGTAPRIAGNFRTGGAGLPVIEGRIEQRPGGNLLTRMTMAEYRVGNGRLALPQLLVAQAPGGALGFAGTAQLSGPLPGGSAEALELPLDGNWSAARGLSMWRGCTPVKFARLTLANLTLDQRALTLCPGPEGAILRSDGRGTRLAAGAPSLEVSGRLGTTPIRIASGPVGFAIPGALAAKRLDIALGPAATATRFQISDLTARIGADIAGRFAGSDVRLFAVPLDLLGANGSWRYAKGRLTITDADFRLQDRQADARFQPLIASGATLALENNRIVAAAGLREPSSNRGIVNVDIRHDLNDGRGHADLAVPGILFDRALQPDTLTRRALGVLANARGTVRGTGRIDWTVRGVTSGGTFTSDAFDFAAAFGPVKGASGTVVFTDLINLVTAPDQRLRIASINPGIEVNDGVLSFQLEKGNVLMVNGATWPFLDGTMTLLPVRMTLGASEVRRYVLKIEGLNAAKFIERMQLGNLSATGIFDGNLPLVFNENGGRIEGGLLIARAPGGNVSYVGALTYKDMGAMANFAFQALRSLDYKQMRIAMDGAIEGEIVTRVRFDGVTQGASAKRNFITQRFAKLPIQFNVNLRAPFYQLITSFKAMYDPAFVKDPRTLGLIDANGRPIKAETVNPPLPPIKPTDIQPSDSRTTP